MSELKVNGKIKLIGEVQTFDSGFRKVEFVLTTNDQYPQDIKFEITQDRVDDFLKYNKVGKDIEVSFNIRGNEYQGKYYVSLQAWKVWGLENNVETFEPVSVEEAKQEGADDSILPF